MRVTLTVRERSCLELLAAGKMTKQIAAELGIARRTVEFHLRSARHKLGTATSVSAVANALTLNLIVVQLSPGAPTIGSEGEQPREHQSDEES